MTIYRHTSTLMIIVPPSPEKKEAMCATVDLVTEQIENVDMPMNHDIH